MHRVWICLTAAILMAPGCCARRCGGYSACVDGCDGFADCAPACGKKCRKPRRSIWPNWGNLFGGHGCGCDACGGFDGGCDGGCGGSFDMGMSGGCASCGQPAGEIYDAHTTPMPDAFPTPAQAPAVPSPAGGVVPQPYSPTPPPAPAAELAPMPAVEMTSGAYLAPQGTLLPHGAQPAAFQAPLQAPAAPAGMVVPPATFPAGTVAPPAMYPAAAAAQPAPRIKTAPVTPPLLWVPSGG